MCGAVVHKKSDGESCNQTQGHKLVLHFAELHFWQKLLRGPLKRNGSNGLKFLFLKAEALLVCFVLTEGRVAYLWLIDVHFSMTGKRSLTHKQA